ncbi:FtsK/SpoIIIE domain-containing protein [Vitreimonas sp.]|uniref:FtsK/SpoIIIE domain-containing protein n=1 Tax=Vitreimonas sp. TaxID=3069702 RepID=UPI002EDB7874
MNALELIGRAGAAYLKARLEATSPEDGLARFMLQSLTGAQIAAIVRAVLDLPNAKDIKIAIPRELVAGEGLPEHVLTDERTVALRNAECFEPILLLANNDDDQGASLGLVTAIGAKELSDDPDYWLGAAAENTGLGADQIAIWRAALRGLSAADDWSLLKLAHFIELTHDALVDQSLPLMSALGYALPALELPRDSGCFSLKARDQTSVARWRKAFEKIISERKPLLGKQRPSRQRIEPEELQKQFLDARADIAADAHAAIQAFIDAPPSWGPEAAALTEFEWEAQGVLLLFSGLRLRPSNFIEETINYFEDDKPDRLNEQDKAYLTALRSRQSIKEANDEDREFYEAHREDLASQRQLRAKWEKFVYGRPIECDDFIDGLMQAVERLYGQAPNLAGTRSIEIRTTRQTNNSWLELNVDVGLNFELRYRGLEKSLGPKVKWEVGRLFKYAELIEKKKKTKKYRPNRSVSRAALQIKFDVTLVVNKERTTVQLIWMARPDAMGGELRDDLDRLANRPFILCEVDRLPVSKKGALQSISLNDVATLQAAYDRDSGSLVPRLTGSQDCERRFGLALKTLTEQGRIAANDALEIGEAWKAFANAYRQALTQWRDNGAQDDWIAQAEAYGSLLRLLVDKASGDVNRQELWPSVLAIGCVAVKGGAPSAIIAPWHPMRLAANAAKISSFAGLMTHLLNAEDVNFGDRRLFFADLRAEFAHAFYPEVAVGYLGKEPVLLAETNTVNDYSLMERPIRDPSEASTDVDPREAARQIRDLVERYLELQPHERSNLSIMLYHCDAAGLPLAAVSALSSMQDEEEVHCNVLVRHRDRSRLQRVYTELLERSDTDADAIVVSETSRNFMSKLRIGISLDGASGVAPGVDRVVDIAFLHDVVSRQAREAWFPAPPTEAAISFAEHVPARWSYRRVTAEDELKATSFLVCPRQPQTGWAYLDAVAAMVRQNAPSPGQHFLPARQISFEDQDLRSAFEEVHGLAEWVATYDDLLDKRQLAAQNVQVIRYRRQRTHGRNMVVSSTSELRILHVLVQQRLRDLSLGLADDALAELARRMVDDAARISGDIVLRAAKRGISAGELIGLVLSKALINEELGSGATIAWFLLDDYAAWLGQREEGLADILALSVHEHDGALKLRAIVSEAKFVDQTGAAEASRKSQQQLRQTVQRMEDALFGDPGRLDRDLWLARLADLLLDGVTAVGQTSALERVRDGVRAGNVEIDLRGYSHIFISGPTDDASSHGDQSAITDVAGGLQETFTRQSVRRAILAYHAREPLATTREKLGDQKPWAQASYRAPAARVNWTDIKPRKVTAKPKPDQSESGADAAATLPPPEPQVPPQSQDVSPAHTPPPESAPTSTSTSTPTELGDTGIEAIGNDAFPALVQSKAQAQVAASAEDEAWLKDTAAKLRSALLGYQFQAQVLGSRLTPNAALVRLKGTDRLRIEDIEAKQSSLLTTHGLRLISITPMPGEIVVGVERPKRQTVSLWDLWARRTLNRNDAGLNTSFILGLRELDGELLYLNLGSPFAGGALHEPHTLVAGATGSGKSVLIQAIILDIAATNSSRMAHIYLIDPKAGVDYAPLERLPHVRDGVIVERPRAVEVMEDLVAEMERRYTLFRERSARDIKSFNLKAPANERLPMIFLVHDEFAEWMLDETYKDAVTANVSRLGVKARAAGIHLIFAAQRPDANVMPMQLRDNLGNRLILRVSSVGTSEIALGQKGAEQLLGLGHLAAKLSGEPSIVFAQAPFLSDEDIDRVVAAIVADD